MTIFFPSIGMAGTAVIFYFDAEQCYKTRAGQQTRISVRGIGIDYQDKIWRREVQGLRVAGTPSRLGIAPASQPAPSASVGEPIDSRAKAGVAETASLVCRQAGAKTCKWLS